MEALFFIGTKGTGSMFYHQIESPLQSFITKMCPMLVDGGGDFSKTFSTKTQGKCTMQMNDVLVVGWESLSAELP